MADIIETAAAFGCTRTTVRSHCREGQMDRSHYCELASQFDNVLRITGDARQVLTMYYPYATKSGGVEFVLEDEVIPDRLFRVTVASGNGCMEFLEEVEEIWLLGDICNDTGQNIPDIQIMSLWPEIKQAALKILATSPSGDT